jgi:uncharacterized protein (TIGR00266 family)
MSDLWGQAGGAAQAVKAVSFDVKGEDLQFVEVTLQPGAAVIGEQGAMMYVDADVEIETVLGDGSASSFGVIGRFFKAVKRSFTGESLFSSRYTAGGNRPVRVAFAAPGPGRILPVDLGAMGGELICQKGAYLAAEQGVEVNLAWQKRLRVGFFGGEGFIMQRLNGQGTAFVHASGTLTELDLEPGQALRVDTGCLVALTPSVRYDIKYAGKMKTALFGGEGLFHATLTGPGKVWLQSMPMSRLSSAVFSSAMVGRSGGGISGKLYLGLIIFFVIVSLVAGGGGAKP